MPTPTHMNTTNLTPVALAALTAYAEEACRLCAACPGFTYTVETLPPVDPRNLPSGATRALARSHLAIRDTVCGETYYTLTHAGAAACAQNNIKLPLA